MKCLIVDDSPLAIDVIESHLEKVSDIEIVAKCTNPIEALNILTDNDIDLVFLDIQMPNLTGLEIVKALKKLPQFIFTTAYPQYALEGFELNATDYLVKPIPLSRFLKAVSRAKEFYKLKTQETKLTNTQNKKYIFVKSEYENVKVRIDSIKYIEGLGGYLKIYSSGYKNPILTLMNFENIINRIASDNFLRIHRSFLVNIDQIDTIQKTKIIIGDKRLPIGDTYKKLVFNKLGLL